MRSYSNPTECARWGFCGLAALLLVTASACSSEKPKETAAAGAGAGVKIMPAGKENSGFLSSYTNLKPSPNIENASVYVRQDPDKNIHKYVAMIVDPVVLYVATDANAKLMPDQGRAAAAEYFQQAITNAVADAFPVVTEPGPLVLRLRSALIGVDVGGEAPAGSAGSGTLARAVNIGKVGVELELVDSETGEQIAAAVDRENLGQGAEIGSANFSREEKFRAATEAFDGWASRLREFLDSAEELSPEDADRADKSYRPYGDAGYNK